MMVSQNTRNTNFTEQEKHKLIFCMRISQAEQHTRDALGAAQSKTEVKSLPKLPGLQPLNMPANMRTP